MRPGFFLRVALLALPLVIAACEDSDIFAEKKTPLPGPRRELFPGGAVPGVDYNQPPIQPSNSNIPVNTEVPKKLLEQEPETPPPAPQPQQTQAQSKQKSVQRVQDQKRANSRNAAPSEDPNDPWAGARTPD
jgi:hypothetical protein